MRSVECRKPLTGLFRFALLKNYKFHYKPPFVLHLHYNGGPEKCKLFGERRSSGTNELFVLARKRML